MVARYKKKRLAEEMTLDAPPKAIRLEGSERQRGKKEAAQGLKDHEDYNDLQIKAEIQWEEEVRQSHDCYMREKADFNYRCTCFGNKCERCGCKLDENINPTPDGHYYCDDCLRMDDVFEDDDEIYD